MNTCVSNIQGLLENECLLLALSKSFLLLIGFIIKIYTRKSTHSLIEQCGELLQSEHKLCIWQQAQEIEY